MKHVLLIVTLTFTSFFTHSQSLRVNKKDLKKQAKIMSGTFSSVEQSKTESNFFHIALHMEAIVKREKEGDS